MNDRTTVTMLEPMRESAMFWGYGQYYFDCAKPKWTWPLQKIGIWFLSHFGTECQHTVEYVEIRQFRFSAAADALLRDARQAVLACYGRTHHLTVYMGPDKYREFMSSKTVEQTMRTGAVRLATDSASLHLTGPKGRWTIYGMELVLVPWIEGMVVVPAVDDLRRSGP